MGPIFSISAGFSPSHDTHTLLRCSSKALSVLAGQTNFSILCLPPWDPSRWSFASIGAACVLAIDLFDCKHVAPNRRFYSTWGKCTANSCGSCSCFLVCTSWSLWYLRRILYQVAVVDCICSCKCSDHDPMSDQAFCILWKKIKSLAYAGYENLINTIGTC